MKKTKDLLVDLDMIYDNLLQAMENADNPLLKSKIGNISNELSNLIDHLDDLIKNPPPHLQQQKRNNTHLTQPSGYYDPNKKTKVDYAHQGRNGKRTSSMHNAQGGFKHGDGYRVKGYED